MDYIFFSCSYVDNVSIKEQDFQCRSVRNNIWKNSYLIDNYMFSHHEAGLAQNL
jgi:hypothetical protein